MKHDIDEGLEVVGLSNAIDSMDLFSSYLPSLSPTYFLSYTLFLSA